MSSLESKLKTLIEDEINNKKLSKEISEELPMILVKKPMKLTLALQLPNLMFKHPLR
jgi:hypothetical protein